MAFLRSVDDVCLLAEEGITLINNILHDLRLRPSILYSERVVLLVMMEMRFKQFSIIYFFTAPMWILFLEALCLFVVRICKLDRCL